MQYGTQCLAHTEHPHCVVPPQNQVCGSPVPTLLAHCPGYEAIYPFLFILFLLSAFIFLFVFMVMWWDQTIKKGNVSMLLTEA